MKNYDQAIRNQKGQILVLSVVFLGLVSILLVGLFHISLAVRQKIRLQISADTVVLSALNCETSALNSIALTNRAILANDALAAQLNALVSESSFYRKLTDRFSRLLRLIPYAGPIGVFLSKGMKTLEVIINRTASAILPMAYLSNKTLSVTQTGIRRAFPYHTIKAAKNILEINMPEAALTPFSQAILIQQTRSLQNSLVNLDALNMEKIRMETMDDHTRKRNWRISVAGTSPVKKTGGTKLIDGKPVAWDKMRMKVISGLRLRWKTVLSSKSHAQDFRYHSPEKMTSFLKKEQGPLLSLGITVKSDLTDIPIKLPVQRQKLTAISAGTLVYRRASKPHEIPNTFNPFWTNTLIPVASEPNLKKMIPAFLLREVRH
jgi:hypothetical protein